MAKNAGSNLSIPIIEENKFKVISKLAYILKFDRIGR